MLDLFYIISVYEGTFMAKEALMDFFYLEGTNEQRI